MLNRVSRTAQNSVRKLFNSKGILADLEAGKTVICDRYAFSGIAFSVAKVSSCIPLLHYELLRSNFCQGLAYSWCRSCDIGLPAPDLVLFLDLSPEAAKLRGGYGEERYESSEIQSKVRTIFKRVGDDVGPKWRVIDAGESQEQVTQNVTRWVEETIAKEKGMVDELWQDDADLI